MGHSSVWLRLIGARCGAPYILVSCAFTCSSACLKWRCRIRTGQKLHSQLLHIFSIAPLLLWQRMSLHFRGWLIGFHHMIIYESLDADVLFFFRPSAVTSFHQRRLCVFSFDTHLGKKGIAVMIPLLARCMCRGTLLSLRTRPIFRGSLVPLWRQPSWKLRSLPYLGVKTINRINWYRRTPVSLLPPVMS